MMSLMITNTRRRRRAALQPRPSIVYGIRVAHRGQVVLGYVGQTRQILVRRAQQHREHQPWGDVMVGSAFIIARGVWSDTQLDVREQWYIRNGIEIAPGIRQRPLFNIDHNRDNPHRVFPWDAQAQRRVRQPGWQPSPNGGWAPRRSRRGRRIQTRAWHLARRRKRLLVWLAVWLFTFATVSTWTAMPALGAAAACLVVASCLRTRARRR